MRYLILTDIHANLEGLRDLPDATRGTRGYDETLVLGDIVGYGPDPNAVIDRVRDAQADGDRPRQSRQGGARHESGRRLSRGGAGRRALDARVADRRRTASGWSALPMGPTRDRRRASRSATARRSTKTRTSSTSSTRAMRSTPRRRRSASTATPTSPSCSASSRTCSRSSARRTATTGARPSSPNAKYLVNPGSVGQPRDGDPRAAYAIYDTDDEAASILIRLALSAGDDAGEDAEGGTAGAAGAPAGARDANPRLAAPILPSACLCRPSCRSRRPLFASLQLHGERIARCARTEHPADHHADQQDRRE